jgi:hypothetical protein
MTSQTTTTDTVTTDVPEASGAMWAALIEYVGSAVGDTGREHHARQQLAAAAPIRSERTWTLDDLIARYLVVVDGRYAQRAGAWRRAPIHMTIESEAVGVLSGGRARWTSVLVDGDEVRIYDPTRSYRTIENLAAGASAEQRDALDRLRSDALRAADALDAGRACYTRRDPRDVTVWALDPMSVYVGPRAAWPTGARLDSRVVA